MIILGNNFNLATDNTNSQAFLIRIIIELLLKLLLSNYRTLIKYRAILCKLDTP